MVDAPGLDIASHTSVAKWTPVNQAFLCNNAIVHNKLVPTYRSMVYSPCRHVTSHMPIARGTHIIIRFRTEASFPHSETVTACAAVIDLACAYSAAWSQTDRNEDTRIGNSCLSPWLLLLLSAASPSPSSCCLPVCHAHLQDPSVVISVPFSCLRCFAFGASSCVWGLSCSLFRFRSAMAAQTSAMARAFFSFAALTATLACVAATRCIALLMLPRGRGHFQQLLQTWSPLQERC